ncbi:hypothetical protein EBL87_01500 [Cereibacter sphaeroides]|uniref:hypothetical protein n=1 Tax=Cereibacter sphaeroides TaxID=1063 RepID=UPI000F5204B9|nr:hypothetical protein [Cereibacter sphaeroides]AZB62465.1 hypothetical protein EBL87_01500 [Cereibacter sphaeroides]AZB69584.1 hypothetical protein EBL86_14925 [Cereibacter sphaeroides]
MNMRPDAFGEARAPAIACPPRPLDELRIVPLSTGLAAIYLDALPVAGRRPRLALTLDGRPAPSPSLSAALPLERGGMRHLVLFAQDMPELLARDLLLTLDGVPRAEARPEWLQPPLRPLPALVEGLAASGRTRFLKMLLTTAASLFSGHGADLAALAQRMLDRCAVPVARPLGAAAFGAGHAIRSHAWAEPPVPGAPVVALGRRIRRLPGCDARSEGGLLHLHLPPAARAEGDLVIFTPDPVRLPPPNKAAAPLTAWLNGRSPAIRAWALGRVRSAAAEDPAAQALLAEMRRPDLPVRLAVRSLCVAPGGLLYAFRLEDSERLVRTLRLEIADRHLDLDLHRGPAGTGLCAGFATLEAEAAPCRIQMVLGSGRITTMATVQPAAFDGSEPDGFAEIWETWHRISGPAEANPARVLAAARRARAPRRIPVLVQRFGSPRTGRIALIAPAGAHPDLISARAAAVGAGGWQAEVLLTLPEGPAAARMRDAAAAAAALHDLPHRLVLHDARAHPAEVLRAAAALIEGPLLILGATVLPATPGWLEDWLRHLEETPALVTAGAVLDHEGAVWEGPLDLGAEGLLRPLDGLPARRLAGTSTSFPSPELAGLSRAGVTRLLASATGHADLAPALAELAAADRAAGTASPFRASHPFRRFGGAAHPTGFAEALRGEELRLQAVPAAEGL